MQMAMNATSTRKINKNIYMQIMNRKRGEIGDFKRV